MSGLMKSKLSRAGLLIATVIVLLFAVAILSTLAKNSQYFPKSNPTHYVNIASKMKVAAPPVLLERAPRCPIAKVVMLQPRAPRKHEIDQVLPLPPSIGVTVSIQHRSPPSSLS
jgi:hypothetical protein